MADERTDTGTQHGVDKQSADTLLEQARLATDQAIELARLAQESARLARDLNAQAAMASGRPLPRSEPEAITTLAGLALAPLNLASVALPAGAVTSPAGSTQQIPPPHVPLPSQPQSWPDVAPEPSASTTSDSPTPAAPLRNKSRRRGKSGRRAVRDRAEQARKRTVEAVPKRVRIRVGKGDLEREAGAAVFFKRNWNSMTISGGVLALTLALLAMYIMPVVAQQRLDTVIASFADEPATVEEAIPVEEPEEEPGEHLEEEVEDPADEPEEPEPEPEPDTEPDEPTPDAPPMTDDADSNEPPVTDSSESAIDFSTTSPRSEAGKRALLQKYGGTAASESAVGNALDWFARHQRRDGSWNFNDVGQSGGAGSVNNPMGATSYVLLAFLGAGQTHLEGKYKRNVAAGLDFLMKWGRPVGSNLIDLSGVGGDDKDSHERFYVHGAATMVFTEAYAMTKARKLRPYAIGGLNAIIASQDPRGGGWRYLPHEPGSTSVTGLQIAALFSAQKAGFTVPKPTLDLASRYLDSAQSDEHGDRYGYTALKPTYKSSVTAIAVLCRMYLGWNRDTPQLQKCVRLLDEKGPASDSLYYVYYATQVMRNWGGDEWTRWNEFTREELIRTQQTTGDAAGSWPPRNRSLEAKAGGRLFMTCLATLTLEVYYRYLPLYEPPPTASK